MPSRAVIRINLYIFMFLLSLSLSNKSRFLHISPKQNVPDIVNYCLYLDLTFLDSSKLSRHC